MKVAGYLRSVITERIVMTGDCADELGISYHITAVFTDECAEDIGTSSVIAGTQDKQMMMDSYDSFIEIMNVMVLFFVVGAVVLGVLIGLPGGFSTLYGLIAALASEYELS